MNKILNKIINIFRNKKNKEIIIDIIIENNNVYINNKINNTGVVIPMNSNASFSLQRDFMFIINGGAVKWVSDD